MQFRLSEQILKEHPNKTIKQLENLNSPMSVKEIESLI